MSRIIQSVSDQCKEIEENNRMGKTRDLFKKIRGTKGTFTCKDGLNKGQKWYGPNKQNILRRGTISSLVKDEEQEPTRTQHKTLVW